MYQNSFSKDEQLEKNCYNKIIAPLFEKMSVKHIFIRYNSLDALKEIQKSADVDIITDDHNTNSSISLKTVRKTYSNLFIETVKNTNTDKPGWIHYTKADSIYYVMLNNFKEGTNENWTEYQICIFDPWEIRELISKKDYKIGYGNTGFYSSQGVLVPLSDIESLQIIKSKGN